MSLLTVVFLAAFAIKGLGLLLALVSWRGESRLGTASSARQTA